MKKSKLLKMTELIAATIDDHFASEPPPDSIPSDHPVWMIVERAVREKFGGGYISIPGLSKDSAEKRNKRIIKDRENGIPVAAIRVKYGLSRAAVYKILKLKKVANPA